MTAPPLYHPVTLQVAIIIINVWLVLEWTLPFRRATSMLADQDNAVDDMLIKSTSAEMSLIG